jgi:hypothetical protein
LLSSSTHQIEFQIWSVNGRGVLAITLVVVKLATWLGWTSAPSPASFLT